MMSLLDFFHKFVLFSSYILISFLVLKKKLLPVYTWPLVFYHDLSIYWAGCICFSGHVDCPPPNIR